MALAIFDLDNTLLNGDSDHAWGEFLVDKGEVDADAYKAANDYFYEQYKKAQLDILDYLEFALKPLAENDLETLTQWHDEFMLKVIEPMMQLKASQLLDQHRQQGDFLFGHSGL